MAHRQRELIDLWDRADRVCEEAQQALQDTGSRLETSVALLAESMLHSIDTGDLVVRSRALLERSVRLRSP